MILIAIVLGTRPEIVKMAPIVREAERRGLDHYIIHTGQHYSYEMDRSFFEQLGLRDAEHNLDVGSGDHGFQTASILSGVERVLKSERTDHLLVQGDTNTVMAGALAAAKMKVGVGHVEAGLRSYDRTMPEEINRIIADHVSDDLFAPTEVSRQNLLREGIPDDRVHVVGNTIVDSVLQNIELSRERYDPLSDLDLKKGRYILMTSHRAENVDVKERFMGILKGASLLGKELGLPVVYPIHPRSRKFLDSYKLDASKITVIDPVGFMEFLQLEAGAAMVLTDSGGVQEETCILKVPCVTLRDNTERPETIQVGGNVLAGTDPAVIIERGLAMARRSRNWDNPFGDGRSASRILDRYA
jgi:UDP-N-acetylglucosamine 2-epimerase (non-hydrolysing)